MSAATVEARLRDLCQEVLRAQPGWSLPSQIVGLLDSQHSAAFPQIRTLVAAQLAASDPIQRRVCTWAVLAIDQG